MKSHNIEEIKMFGDSAEPKTIESIRRAGFDIESSMKEVREGIDCVKSYKLFIHSSSIKLQEELRKYKWKIRNEMRTDEPVKLFDDGLCAIRYALYTWTNRNSRRKAYDFDVDWIDL
jgi:phage terminase large subunit